MTDFDLFRIMQIDDCEGVDTGYQFPEKDLPEPFNNFFKIVRSNMIPGPSTVRTPADFTKIFPKFWNHGDDSIFPVDLIAMDYNLSKWSDILVTDDDEDDPDEDGMLPDDFDVSGNDGDKSFGFEGLVLGIFYSSLVSQHPTGVVPMTNYGDILEKYAEVRCLHDISKGLLNIDYSKFGVSGDDRKWENIFSQGVKALRQRIESLFLEREVTISPEDLIDIYKNKGEVLTVRSKYCVRRWPIKGLFIDFFDDPEKQQEEIIKWVAFLLSEYDHINIEHLSESKRIADKLWECYNDDDRFMARWNLSEIGAKVQGQELAESGENVEGLELSDSDVEVFKSLCDKFGVKDSIKSWKVCKDYVIDINEWDVDDATKRWVSIFVLSNLLKRVYHAQKNWAKCNEYDHYSVPTVSASDWFIALYPCSSGSLVLPPHKLKKDKGGYKQSATPDWMSDNRAKILRRLKNNGDYAGVEDIKLAVGDKDFGSIGLIPKDVFEGVLWGKTIITGKKSRVSGGLTKGERGILRLLLVDWEEQNDDEIMKCGQIRKILNGGDDSE